MLTAIRGKLESMKASGEIDLKNQEMKEKTLNYLRRPSEVKEITDTTEEKGILLRSKSYGYERYS